MKKSIHQYAKQAAGAFFCCVLALGCLTGCGASGNGTEMRAADTGVMYFSESEAYDYAVEEDYAEALMDSKASLNTGSTTASADGTAQTQENDLASRKLIKDANLTLETKEYDGFLDALAEQIAAHGGYVQSGELSGSGESSRANRWAYYTIRVPADRYDSFLSGMSGLGNVTYRTENVQDVTMTYTDIESHIRALETEYETLLTILEKCTDLDDVIKVQSRVTEVNYQLDSYKSQLRRYDDLISYCTVYLHVNEVERETIPAAEKTVGQRIAEELADNCEKIADDAKDLAVWFVSSLPFFGIWILVIGGIGMLAVVLLKRSRRKFEKRRAERALQEAQAAPAKQDEVQN